MWAVGFHTNVNQTNKQTKFCTGHLQNPRKFADGMNPAYWQLQSSISMDQSIILATIATIAGNYKEMYIVTYVNIIVTNIN